MTTDQLQRKLRSSRLLNLVLAVALVFVGASYAALVWGGSENGSSDQPPQVQQSETITSDAETESPAGAQEQVLQTQPYMVIGDPDAPVVLFEWTDFTCPYCALFHRDTLPTIIEDYVDTGQVRIEIHDVTFIGPQAEDAAVAARAAGQQDRYFDYLFAVYELSRDGERPDLSPETLTGLAVDLGLDIDRFNTDFVAAELRAEVQESTALAQSLSISAVPYFVGSVGGSLEQARSMQGAQPLENVQMFLDSMIDQAGA